MCVCHRRLFFLLPQDYYDQMSKYTNRRDYRRGAHSYQTSQRNSSWLANSDEVTGGSDVSPAISVHYLGIISVSADTRDKISSYFTYRLSPSLCIDLVRVVFANRVLIQRKKRPQTL